jgi:hypothetical protein
MWTVDAGIFGQPSALTSMAASRNARAFQDYGGGEGRVSRARKQPAPRPWFVEPSSGAQSPHDTDLEKKDMERKAALVFMLHVATDGIRR